MSVQEERTILETISEIRTEQVLNFLGSIAAQLVQILVLTLVKLTIVAIFKLLTIKLLKLFALDLQTFSIFSKADNPDLENNKILQVMEDYGDYEDPRYQDYRPGYNRYQYQDKYYTGKLTDDKAYRKEENRKEKEREEGMEYDQDYMDDFLARVNNRRPDYEYAQANTGI